MSDNKVENQDGLFDFQNGKDDNIHRFIQGASLQELRSVFDFSPMFCEPELLHAVVCPVCAEKIRLANSSQVEADLLKEEQRFQQVTDKVKAIIP